jgi:quercetin dioxygenase-like cupin family protein
LGGSERTGALFMQREGEDTMRVFSTIVALVLTSLLLSAQAQEPLKVDTKGVTASILFEAPITGGHVADLEDKYKLRVTEIAIAGGGYVGHHNHLGPGIRQMTEGEMDYIMPDETVVYRAGDFFFETGDVSHRVESPQPSMHLLFEILPIDVDGPSLILPRDK